MADTGITVRIAVCAIRARGVRPSRTGKRGCRKITGQSSVGKVGVCEISIRKRRVRFRRGVTQSGTTLNRSSTKISVVEIAPNPGVILKRHVVEQNITESSTTKIAKHVGRPTTGIERDSAEIVAYKIAIQRSGASVRR